VKPGKEESGGAALPGIDVDGTGVSGGLNRTHKRKKGGMGGGWGAGEVFGDESRHLKIMRLRGCYQKSMKKGERGNGKCLAKETANERGAVTGGLL